MKSRRNFVSVAALSILVGFLVSCATGLEMYRRPLSEFQGAEIIGTVQTTFEVIFRTDAVHYEIAYIALLEEAKKKYNGNIDIADISVVLTKMPGAAGIKPSTFSANGKVITINPVNTMAVAVEGALEDASEELAEDFPAKSRLAIVFITSPDKSVTEYIIGELEHTLRRQGFFIVDRSELDRVRAEQQFGTTPEVDEKTAARIGHFAGANIVITGRVDGEGNLRRLRLRALNSETGQVVGTASQRL